APVSTRPERFGAVPSGSVLASLRGFRSAMRVWAGFPSWKSWVRVPSPALEGPTVRCVITHLSPAGRGSRAELSPRRHGLARLSRQYAGTAHASPAVSGAAA